MQNTIKLGDRNAEIVSGSSNSQQYRERQIQQQTATFPKSPILWLFSHETGMSFSKGKPVHVFPLLLGKSPQLLRGPQGPADWPLTPFPAASHTALL